MYSRQKWGARSPRGLTRDGRKHTVVVHYSAGSGLAIDTLAEQRAAMRSIQNLHMDGNGWSDIGYAIIVFQPRGRLRSPRVYEGRDIAAIPAAQAGANSGTIPVCVVAAPGEKLNWRTRRRLVKIARNQRRKRGATRLKGHRDLTPTSCPGDVIYGQLGYIARKSGLTR